MDNKKYDDLDKLFRSRLKNEEVHDQNWNKPPQSILDGALAVLDKQDKKRRRRLLWWIIPVMILLGFTLVTVNHLNKIDNLESTIAALKTGDKNQLEKIQSNSESSPTYNTIGQNDREISSSQNSKTQHLNAPKKINTTLTKNQKTTKNDRDINQSINSLTATSRTERIDAIQAADKFENPEMTTQEIVSTPWLLVDPNRNISSPAILPVIISGIASGQKDFTRNAKPSLRSEKDLCCPNKSWQIFALSGVNASTIKMTNIGNPDFTLTGYERYYTDWFTGLGIEYSFHPKWSIQMEAAYNKMHIKSTYENEFSYDKSLEYTDNQGNLNYEANYEVATVMGRQSSVFSIDLGEKIIADNDELQNQTLIDNSFETLSIGLGVQYQLFCHKNWSLDLGFGLQYNYLLQLSEQMESSIYHENGLMFRESIAIEAMEKTNQSFGSLSGNIRLGYEISDQLGLKLNLGSTHSLHSIRKSNFDQAPKTYINQLKAAFQVHYSF